MKRLREKLNSRSGASILMALLFFLLCMMVAASVLMAAASNAGKLKSNRDEQQKYLTLSSALRLVADQLEQAEYTGKYATARWTEVLYEPDPSDPERTIPVTHYYYWYKQDGGAFTCGALASGTSYDILPWRDTLDGIFQRELASPAYGYAAGKLLPNATTTPSTHTLAIEVTGTGDLPELTREVQVKLELNENRHISLSAALEDENGRKYTMDAEMLPAAPTPIEPAPNDATYNEWKDDPGPGVRVDHAFPVTWKLNWIAKGVGG